MNEPITIGMIVWPVLIITGLGGLVALLLFLVWLFNPFRSGH